MLELKCDYNRINKDGEKNQDLWHLLALANVRWRVRSWVQHPLDGCVSRKNVYIFTKKFYITYTVKDFVVCYIAFQLIEVSLVGNLG